MVIHSKDGLDEISIAADTVVCELRNGRLDRYVVSPVDFDLPLQTLEGLDIQNPCQSAEVIQRALAGDSNPIFKKAANMLAMNAGATIYISGIASSFAEGVAKAKKVLNNGEAEAKLRSFTEFSAAVPR